MTHAIIVIKIVGPFCQFPFVSVSVQLSAHDDGCSVKELMSARVIVNRIKESNSQRFKE